MAIASQSATQRRHQQTQHLRNRFTISLTIYGALLAASAAIIGTITSDFPNPPERLTDTAALITPSGAALITALILYPTLRWISTNIEESRILPLWLGIGIAFGITTIFLAGASIPFTGTLTFHLIKDIPSFTALRDDILDSFIRAPLFSFTYGVLSLYTGIITGITFGIGAWLIDIINRMAYPHQQPDPWLQSLSDHIPQTKQWAAKAAPQLANIGPYAIAITLGTSILLATALAPIQLLAKLKLG